jgi:hypothetical protein
MIEATCHCGAIKIGQPRMPLAKQRIDRMGVNARNLDPEIRNGIRVRRLDGASTWKWLD